MKKYKNKKSACALCKPHKRGWEDNRSMQTRKQDAQAQADRRRA